MAPDHDPQCLLFGHPEILEPLCQCTLIEIVRADERERTNTVRGHRRIYAEGRTDLANDLREQVADLEDPGCRRVVGGCDCRRSQALRDVLALLEEKP